MATVGWHLRCYLLVGDSMATATVQNRPGSEVRIHGPNPAGPCAMVIFGITGDLSKRLLLPALYNLATQGLLSDHFALIGFALSNISEDQLRDALTNDLTQVCGPNCDARTVRWLVSRLRFISSDFESESGWQRLRSVIDEADRAYALGGNYLFYLATAPDFFLPLVKRLHTNGLLDDSGNWRRVVIEKPFGHDLESARSLNRELLSMVHDDQVYRIDHYLGKETVQNIMVFRFANGIFEPIWNRRYIDHVQITVAESIGVERRGRYYDHTGALRDMVPNHLAQLLALTAMEPPASFSASALQNEQVKALESVPPINPEECVDCVVRGQYTAGAIGEVVVGGYREEPYVAPDSQTETYVALKMAVDNWRWAGVPFYLRTGKRLRKRNTHIVVQFRKAPLALFRQSGASAPRPNCLVLGIQPQENICLEFEGKVPGPVIETTTVNMEFDYRRYFGVANRTGYETLLYDAMIGDATLFKRADTIEAGWAIVQPILDAWAAGRGGELHFYGAGSEGPPAADEMMRRDGRAWRAL
jgi:glucose-6-phosphate 1-dehydrogenase